MILPALDSRVKNVAHSYSLEHKVESDLFDQIARLLSAALADKGKVASTFHSDLVCCTQALHTTLCQHLAKEEEQVQIIHHLHKTGHVHCVVYGIQHGHKMAKVLCRSTNDTSITNATY